MHPVFEALKVKVEAEEFAEGFPLYSFSESQRKTVRHLLVTSYMAWFNSGMEEIPPPAPVPTFWQWLFGWM